MMPATTATASQTEVSRFLQASLRAIVRAEADGRLPRRFTGAGEAVWHTFRNELTVADLAGLAVQDAGVAMPMPFDPAQWWPGWPDWALLRQSPQEVAGWLEEALEHLDRPTGAYLRDQAALLEIEPPPEAALAGLSTPAAHEQWLELPGTGGWVAYTLCTRPDSRLYYWENFQVLCATPKEMLLAGLIGWELGAPPRTPLPIRLEDADLAATLRAGRTYHAIIGRRDRHKHRDLRVLHYEGGQPIWI